MYLNCHDRDTENGHIFASISAFAQNKLIIIIPNKYDFIYYLFAIK